jgi:hypothetical protein
MKILIGYEGAPAGEAALADLKRAGFPARGEATVFTVADVWPSANEEPALPCGQSAFPTWLKCMSGQKTFVRSQRASLAWGGAGARLLPGWRVTAEAVCRFTRLGHF